MVEDSGQEAPRSPHTAEDAVMILLVPVGRSQEQVWRRGDPCAGTTAPTTAPGVSIIISVSKIMSSILMPPLRLRVRADRLVPGS